MLNEQRIPFVQKELIGINIDTYLELYTDPPKEFKIIIAIRKLGKNQFLIR